MGRRSGPKATTSADAKRAAYRSHLRNHILPRFGDVPLDTIDRHSIKVFVKHLKTQLADCTVASVIDPARR